MTGTPKNIPASIRQRLLQESRKQEIDFNLMLTKYALERFLYRLGCSSYHERFVLKGAMLFPLWGIDTFRPTRDLDLLGFGESEQEHLVRVFRDICQIEVDDDGISYDPESVTVTAIRDQMEYGGSRIVINAELAKARIQVQIDVGFGDVVTPQPTYEEYPTLLKLPAPVLRAYPRETVVAEKFQAMVALGIANSRMKDLFDLWFIGGCPPIVQKSPSLSNQSRLFEVFRRLKYNGFLFETSTGIRNWLCNNFMYRSKAWKKDLNQHSVWDILSKAKGEPSPKSRICKMDWLRYKTPVVLQ